jgi:hypothetical protein
VSSREGTGVNPKLSPGCGSHRPDDRFAQASLAVLTIASATEQAGVAAGADA